MANKVFRVLDAAPLNRRSMIVLGLDTTKPVAGLATGTKAAIVSKGGVRQRVMVKGVGITSPMVKHTHILVSAPKEFDAAKIERIEIL